VGSKMKRKGGETSFEKEETEKRKEKGENMHEEALGQLNTLHRSIQTY
jgi:hypothetical protein